MRMDLYANDRLVVENGLILENVKLGTVSDKTSIQLKAVLKSRRHWEMKWRGREFPVNGILAHSRMGTKS